MPATQQVQPPPGVVAAIPFTAAAHEYTELAFTRTVTPGAGVQQIDPIDIPAAGFFRSIVLEVVGAGGVPGAGVASDDYPWNLFQGLNLADVNGGNLYGPIDGFAAMVTNLLGGYAARSNPADSPQFQGASMVAPSFFLRIPVEITRKNGLGALANQSSSSNYRLSLAINTLAAMFTTAPTTAPTFTIRGWYEGWTIPTATDAYGNPQAQVPPLPGIGQYWTSRTQAGIIAGATTLDMRRLGNYIRVLAFIARNAAGVRQDNVMPDLMTLNWDTNNLREESQSYNRFSLYEKTDGTVLLPTGVFAFPFNHGGEGEGNLGNEDADLWVPSTASSRLTVEGQSLAAGSVQILTNDVSSAEVSPTGRYVTPSATGRQLAPAQ